MWWISVQGGLHCRHSWHYEHCQEHRHIQHWSRWWPRWVSSIFRPAPSCMVAPTAGICVSSEVAWHHTFLGWFVRVWTDIGGWNEELQAIEHALQRGMPTDTIANAADTVASVLPTRPPDENTRAWQWRSTISIASRCPCACHSLLIFSTANTIHVVCVVINIPIYYKSQIIIMTNQCNLFSTFHKSFHNTVEVNEQDHNIMGHYVYTCVSVHISGGIMSVAQRSTTTDRAGEWNLSHSMWVYEMRSQPRRITVSIESWQIESYIWNSHRYCSVAVFISVKELHLAAMLFLYMYRDCKQT
jgi:hypothetical protein